MEGVQQEKEVKEEMEGMGQGQREAAPSWFLGWHRAQ
jgi:hypothetical protein